MKRKDVNTEAIRASAMRSTRASAALERRTIPAGTKPSAQVSRFLAARKRKG